MKKNKILFVTIRKILFCLVNLYILLLLWSCNEDPTSPPEITISNTIDITLEFRDFYQIAIKWNKANEDKGNSFTYRLKRLDEIGNQFVKDFYLSGDDTIYIDDNEGDSLETSTRYNYKVEGINTNKELKDTSKTLLTSTLVPTSHDIEWEVDTIGNPGDLLYDVWGTDTNNVWAVGAVEMPEGTTAIIKWDGSQWNYFPWPEATIVTIHGQDVNNFWVAGTYGGSYGFTAIWDGQNWNETNFLFELPAQDTVWALRAIWGSSPNNIWAVGWKGTIIHWDGVRWSKDSSILLNKDYILTDVWGFNKEDIYITGTISQDKLILLKYDGNKWNIIIEKQTYSRRSTIWGPHTGLKYLVEYQSYEIRNGNSNRFILPNRTSEVQKIRGSDANNIFTIGDYGEVFHFNGIDWMRINELYVYPDSRFLGGCFTTENKAFIVGLSSGSHALSIQGKIK